MSCKERPPRIFSDKKGYYIINGDKKMRISQLNNNNNANVVNVILKECRTKQKRKKTNKPKLKQPIQMKPLEQQVNDANYKLYHIIQDRKREAEQQLKTLIENVQNKSIGIPSTDNSLIAIAREQKISPSELSAKIEPSVSEQILQPENTEEQKAPLKEDAPPILDEPTIPQQEDQLISNVKDLNANLPPDMLERINEIKEQKAENTLELFSNYAKNFLSDNVDKLIHLGEKYALDTSNLDDLIKELLKNNDFIGDFIKFYEGNTKRQQEKLYNRIMSGSGKGSLMTGLYDDQINDMLRSEPNYCGCISRDEIHKLKLDDKGKYGFVYNTVPSNKPTKYEGHWRAIYIDLDDGKSIDHYDSFGEPAEEDIQEQIKKLLEQFNLPYYLKWKDNKIINQRSNSSNCGFFCVNFLQDRFEGIPFVDSTGYSNVMKSEKDLKKKFGYLV